MLKAEYYTAPTDIDLVVFDKLIPQITICAGSKRRLTLSRCGRW